MQRTGLVCLCELYDLKELFGEYFATEHPWLNLLSPGEIPCPAQIRHAFVFSPGAKAFVPYANLKLVSCAGAGDAHPRAVARWAAQGMEQFERGEEPQGLVDRTRGY